MTSSPSAAAGQKPMTARAFSQRSSTIFFSIAFASLNTIETTREQITAVFRDFYKDSPLVRLRPAGHLPQIQYVVRTNFCDLGFELAPNGRRLVLVSCLDNLLKGAAGQAVQNMNVMCGWNEAEGLL